MPFLIAWGLPLSLASPIGNLLFLPFLTAFLFIAAHIFFLELLWLPNSWFIYALEKITSWWLYVISFGRSSWLISFAKPSFWVLITLPLLALLILYYKKIRSTLLSCIILLIVLLTMGLYLKYQSPVPANTILEIPCNGGVITLVKHNTILTLIDTGILGRSISTPSWIEFTLLPTLNKQFGTTTINNIIILQPSIMTFECIEKICQLCSVNNFYMPLWSGEADKKLLRNYGFMRRALEHNKTMIKRFAKKELSVTPTIIITPLTDTITYKNISFPAYLVTIIFENKTIEIYSAKKRK